MRCSSASLGSRFIVSASSQPSGRGRRKIFPFIVRDALTVGTKVQRNRFWRQVDRSGSCWWWRGEVNAGGHAFFVVEGRSEPVARAAFMFAFGTIPDNDKGTWPLYSSCHRRLCVNPDHHALNELNVHGVSTGR